ncbi:MAG: adenylate/guanylate cyclase domain-containing protein [Planctomycetota bacterium]|nr:adenylate/guanylate cyclase domain-containing protein [Planctomycetota bacterium]
MSDESQLQGSADPPATILLVDDNPSNLHVLMQALEDSGHKLLASGSGEEALKIARSERPELILLDIMMPPGIDGYETCERIKRDEATRDCTVIFTSALEETQSKVRGLRLGAVDYITKPFQPEEVAARVATHLTVHRLRRALARKNEELEKANRFIRQTFGRYVSEDVVDQVLDSPEGLALGGEEREVTIVMSDLRNFSAQTEQLAPEATIARLNGYLEKMVEVIFRYQGTILEIVGDAIMVVFGAPVPCDDHAERATACALVMQLTMPEINRELAEQGLPPLEMGIGIHTGPVVMGNIGSRQRTKYAAVGRHVNLAGRIESHTTGGQVLISEDTQEAISKPLECRRRIQIEPKGFQESITLYDVRGIGMPYNLQLPIERSEPEPLPRPLAVRFSVLEEKIVGRTVLDGRLTHLSEKDAILESDAALAELSNLKLFVLDDRGEVVGGALYAKVVDTAPTDTPAVRLRFTSSKTELDRIHEMI